MRRRCASWRGSRRAVIVVDNVRGDALEEAEHIHDSWRPPPSGRGIMRAVRDRLVIAPGAASSGRMRAGRGARAVVADRTEAAGALDRMALKDHSGDRRRPTRPSSLTGREARSTGCATVRTAAGGRVTEGRPGRRGSVFDTVERRERGRRNDDVSRAKPRTRSTRRSTPGSDGLHLEGPAHESARLQLHPAAGRRCSGRRPRGALAGRTSSPRIFSEGSIGLVSAEDAGLSDRPQLTGLELGNSAIGGREGGSARWRPALPSSTSTRSSSGRAGDGDRASVGEVGGDVGGNSQPARSPCR
jgi:hypothetical protein